MSRRYFERPPASSRSARIAWDEMSRRAKPKTLVELWHCRSLSPYSWQSMLSDGEYMELDDLEVRDMRNNPHKYA